MLKRVELHYDSPFCNCPKDKRPAGEVNLIVEENKWIIKHTCMTCNGSMNSIVKSVFPIYERENCTTKEQAEKQMKELKEKHDLIEMEMVKMDILLEKLKTV